MEAAPTQTSQPQPGKKAKRFQCPHCQRSFARLEHLQRHERIHSGEKPFRCAECNYSFTRSDLLVRHERLTHRKAQAQAETETAAQNGEVQADKPVMNSVDAPDEVRSHKRMRSSIGSERPVPELRSMMSSPTVNMQSAPGHSASSLASLTFGHTDQFSLTALSMAAEYQALHGVMDDKSQISEQLPMPVPAQAGMTSYMDNLPSSTAKEPQMTSHDPGFSQSLDNLTSFFEGESLSTYNFASLIGTEQTFPFFTPDLFEFSLDALTEANLAVRSSSEWTQRQQEDAQSLSRFDSRFPSSQPEDTLQEGETRQKSIAEITHEDRQNIIDMLEEYSTVIPSAFQLPTRLAFCRYIAAYINCFHAHMPFLHIPTMSVRSCSIELILALAAVGAQYTFESERGVELFNVSRAIATYRIKRRNARLVEMQQNSDPTCSSNPHVDSTIHSQGRATSISGLLESPSQVDPVSSEEDIMQTAQALLLLMALCTWAKHKETLREALEIQSVLATLIREDGLTCEPLRSGISWSAWIRRESIKRTKFAVYGFSNLHCIVYNIPPFILTSEVNLELPCKAETFEAATEAAWIEAMRRSGSEVLFQDALKRLFSKEGKDVTERTSSSGNYALIHALIQQIFFLRQTARCRFDCSGELSHQDVTSLELALRNWHHGWRRNPESSLDPRSPSGPVALNSMALLRLAYIRLHVDTAGRALETRDPLLIANAFRAGPPVNRSPKITRAVLHSAHALSIPIKIGYRLIAKTQSFVWSIQHCLCTLECAYLMSKWFEALSLPMPDPAMSEDERRVVALVKRMLDETEFAVPDTIPLDSPSFMKHLSAGVLRVWATVFTGTQIWAIVDLIGRSLNLYANMVEAD
ncbi:hypothetical protein ACN47E_007337 [Coniothyrium glycines]